MTATVTTTTVATTTAVPTTTVAATAVPRPVPTAAVVIVVTAAAMLVVAVAAAFAPALAMLPMMVLVMLLMVMFAVAAVFVVARHLGAPAGGWLGGGWPTGFLRLRGEGGAAGVSTYRSCIGVPPNTHPSAFAGGTSGLLYGNPVSDVAGSAPRIQSHVRYAYARSLSRLNCVSYPVGLASRPMR
ncbi:MAG: hypothetical protein QOG69_2321 [Actinomycetota bacterium]|nr:hypothetical protein [Actinomycetota bacterium]